VITALLIFIIILMLPSWLLGTFTFVMLLKPEKEGNGVDASNRINFITLWWFSLTRRAMFLPVCPFLSNDQLDNVSK